MKAYDIRISYMFVSRLVHVVVLYGNYAEHPTACVSQTVSARDGVELEVRFPLTLHDRKKYISLRSTTLISASHFHVRDVVADTPVWSLSISTSRTYRRLRNRE